MALASAQGNTALLSYSARDWAELLDHRSRKWEEAERLSDELGYPYKDRNDMWRNTQPRDLVGLTLRDWCQKRGITYS